jgi:alginate O-acetyltransferase complex protein AlgI
MQFNSYSYLLLLGVVVTLYWLLPAGTRRWYLLVLSLGFYASWNWWYVVLPVGLCAAVFPCARRMKQQPGQAGRWLKIGIAVVLVVLCFFKYRDFFLANWNGVLQLLGQTPIELGWRLALPLGISFYSFEAISYLIDTRQGRVKEVRFSDLLLFVTFWPHLIAGPIVRVRELVPQFFDQRRFQYVYVTEGLGRLCWGLVQKNVFANTLSSWVDEGFLTKAAGANSTIDNWTLAFAFGLQIYFDFAAYSNMAIGSARLVGITLPENFRFPYQAANPSDFWSRWHMTLSRWIRDYLFFRINARYKGAALPLYASLVGIMALVGLWHGAGWGFVLWGIFHGVYLVLYRMWENVTEGERQSWREHGAVRLGWRLFTLLAVMLAWIPFRASSIEQTLTLLRSMLFSFRWSFSYNVNFYLLTLLLALFVMAEPWLAGWWEMLEKQQASSQRKRVTLAVLRPALLAAALFLFLIFDDQNTQFIYFQF